MADEREAWWHWSDPTHSFTDPSGSPRKLVPSFDARAYIIGDEDPMD